MHYRALQTHCIVRVERGEERSKGGIITVIEGSRESMAREEGTIVDLGPDMYADSTSGNRDQVKVGDRVCFARYAGKTLGTDADGMELRILNDIDLLAKQIED